jgi:hypothetical protein
MADDTIRRTLHQVRRRLLAVRAVESGLRWTLYGTVLAALGIAVSALVYSFLPAGYVHPWTPLLAIPLAFLLGVGLRLARPVTLRSAAIYLDRRAGLEERVATACELLKRGDEAPLGRLVCRQADEVCRKFRPGMIRYTRRLGRDARYLVVALVACGAMLFVPPLKTQGYRDRERYQARREAALEQLEEFMRPIRPKEFEGDERIRELMRQMEQAGEELRNASAMAPETDLAALSRLRQELEDERARREADKGLAESVEEARKVKTLDQAFADTQAGAEKRKELAEKIASGRLTTEEKRALQRVSRAAETAARCAGDGQLGQSAGGVREALGDGQGDAESLAEGLGRMAEAAGDAAAGQGEGSAESDARIAAAIDAVDRAKEQMAPSAGAGDMASAGSPQGADNQGAGSQGAQGQGQQPCPQCGGSGKQPGGGQCSACGGSGRQAAGAAAAGAERGGGGSTNLDNPSGPGDQAEHEEVGPESEFARIYEERIIPHTARREFVPSEVDPNGQSAGRQFIQGPPDPNERSRIGFVRSFADAAAEAEEALEEMAIPADMKKLVQGYFRRDGR